MGDRKAGCRLIGMIQEKKKKKKKSVRDGIITEAMPLGRGQWMGAGEQGQRPVASVHKAAEDRRPAQWAANVGQRTFPTRISSDKETKAPRH